jgi:hypothetical protein
VEQGRDGQRHAERRLDVRQHRHRQQGMAAGLEKVLVHAVGAAPSVSVQIVASVCSILPVGRSSPAGIAGRSGSAARSISRWRERSVSSTAKREAPCNRQPRLEERAKVGGFEPRAVCRTTNASSTLSAASRHVERLRDAGCRHSSSRFPRARSGIPAA